MHEVLKKLQSGYLTVWGVIAAAAAAEASMLLKLMSLFEVNAELTLVVDVRLVLSFA